MFSPWLLALLHTATQPLLSCVTRTCVPQASQKRNIFPVLPARTALSVFCACWPPAPFGYNFVRNCRMEQSVTWSGAADCFDAHIIAGKSTRAAAAAASRRGELVDVGVDNYFCE
jgi:hypothetical protein